MDSIVGDENTAPTWLNSDNRGLNGRPAGFAKPKPRAEMQTWYLAVTQHDVTLRRTH
jgi:hypothetical protein